MNSEKNTNEKKYQMFHVKPEYQFVEEPVYEYSKQMGLDTDFSRRSILFLEHLLDYNRKVNLVSRRDEQNIVINQWLHSLICLPLLKADQPDRVLDIGSGGGFPGFCGHFCFAKKNFCW